MIVLMGFCIVMMETAGEEPYQTHHQKGMIQTVKIGSLTMKDFTIGLGVKVSEFNSNQL